MCGPVPLQLGQSLLGLGLLPLKILETFRDLGHGLTALVMLGVEPAHLCGEPRARPVQGSDLHLLHRDGGYLLHGRRTLRAHRARSRQRLRDRHGGRCIKAQLGQLPMLRQDGLDLVMRNPSTEEGRYVL